MISGKLISDGTFLEKVKEKYGDDALIKKGESEEESNSYDSEVDHSSSSSGEDVGPRFEETNPEKEKLVQKVEDAKDVGPDKITKKRMMPSTFIHDKLFEKEEQTKPQAPLNKPRFIIKDDDLDSSHHSGSSDNEDRDSATFNFGGNKRIKRDDYE